MSQELLSEYKLKVGQKVLYPHHHPNVIDMQILTIKDIVVNYNQELIVLTDELNGYIYPSEIYTQRQILMMFNPKDYENNYTGIWHPAHKLAELAVESSWDSIKLINLLIDKIGAVRTIDLVKEATEKLKENYE